MKKPPMANKILAILILAGIANLIQIILKTVPNWEVFIIILKTDLLALSGIVLSLGIKPLIKPKKND